jgi:predicted NUDIX family phosphoesterase
MTHTIFRHHAPDLPESGCITTDVLDFLHPLLWQVRAEVEHDERYLQTVVYLLLFNPAGAIQSDVGFWERGHLALGCFDGKMPSLPGFWLMYHITLNRTPIRQAKCGAISAWALQLRHRGYMDAQDASVPFNPVTTLHQTLLRELGEELQMTPADLLDVRLRGLIYEGLSAVGRVHLGMLHTAQWCGANDPEPQQDEKLASLGFVDLADISAQPRFELWSRLAAQYLGCGQ